jgi:ribosomal protein L13
MRRIILATLAAAAALTGASAADAQYYGGRADGVCRREASRAWNRREADRIYRHCVREMRNRWRNERRYDRRGW